MPCRLRAGAMAAGALLTALLTACAGPASAARADPTAATHTPSPSGLTQGQPAAVFLRFERGSTLLDAEHRASLVPILERLRADPRAIATITSHAVRMEFETARARAAAVRRVLTTQGTARRRIRVVNAGMAAGADPEVVRVQVR
jgi:type IV pilus biogenesis protein CpaD/CtpE